MSPRSLFNIILKVIGIFFVKDLVLITPQMLSSVLFLFSIDSASEGAWIFVTTLITIILYGLVIVYLVLKTNWVIDKFELTKGIAEERIEINLHRSTVIYICLVLSGLLVATTAFPAMLKTINAYYQVKRVTRGEANPDATDLIYYTTSFIAGLLMMIYAKLITNWIELRRRKS